MPENAGTMRTLLSGICLFIATISWAQRECGSALYTDQQKSIDPSFSDKIAAIEKYILAQKQLARESGEEAPKLIRIPVIVHVLYRTATQNISDLQIQSQIDALNRDFRRRNADTANTPERFKPFAADVQIEFALATADPNGRPTTGILRKATSVSHWSTDDRIKYSVQGGDDAWDSRYYLNFWIGDLGTLLGYSSLPGAPADKDGVVINYSAFGTLNVTAPYDLGRTATHEVGHWLGLKHIWGDSFCGDDLVDDTPKQGNFTSGCPSTFRSSCDNGELGDMYMNYMDFTNDACMNLFTAGQKQRMLALFDAGGPRNLLLSSRGLNPPWMAASPAGLPVSNQLQLYPNPTHGDLVLDFDFTASWVGKTLTIVNINGIPVAKVAIVSKVQTIHVGYLPAGMYFLQGENGDQQIRGKFIRL